MIDDIISKIHVAFGGCMCVELLQHCIGAKSIIFKGCEE